MNDKSRLSYEARAEIAKALGHPTRLLLLDTLSKREMCVGELAELARADKSTVSKHLAILRNVGLVASRKDGPTSYYRGTCVCLEGFFSCIETVLRQNLKNHKAALAGGR